MNKKLVSFMMIIIMLIVNCSVVLHAETVSRKTAYASYGTPVIDGEIDEIWNKTPGYVVENCNKTGQKVYKGWFKVLWDENYVYILAKEYAVKFSDFNTDPWNHDSVDFYFDEKSDRNMVYNEDDYQVRCNYKGMISGNNYPEFTKIKAQAKTYDNYFITEAAIPLVTVSPRENLTLGFEVLMTASKTLGMTTREYLWNTTSKWVWNNTDCFGNLVLLKNAPVANSVKYEIDEWVAPVAEDVYDEEEKPVEYVSVDGVTVYFDKKVYNYPVICADEYPMMERDLINLEDINWSEDAWKCGVQYPGYFIEENEIVAVVRTAINGADNFHNANAITFHRFKDINDKYRF